jgi:hypothetical protein
MQQLSDSYKDAVRMVSQYGSARAILIVDLYMRSAKGRERMRWHDIQNHIADLGLVGPAVVKGEQQ